MRIGETGFERVNQRDYYGGYPTAHIDARIIDGKIIDIRDGAEIKLNNEALVRIVAYKSDIPEEHQDRFFDQRQMVLEKGKRIGFSIISKDRQRYIDFEVLMQSDGYMVKAGNKPSRFTCEGLLLLPTSSSHEYLNEPVPVSTLNQAYTMMSVRINPEALSHTINVYDHFSVIGGKQLKYYRI